LYSKTNKHNVLHLLLYLSTIDITLFISALPADDDPSPDDAPSPDAWPFCLHLFLKMDFVFEDCIQSVPELPPQRKKGVGTYLGKCDNFKEKSPILRDNLEKTS
jgi:hypothetical protein